MKASTCTIWSEDTEEARSCWGCIEARRPAAADERRPPTAARLSRLPPAAASISDIGLQSGAEARRLAETRWLAETGCLLSAVSNQGLIVAKLWRISSLELVELRQHVDGRSDTGAAKSMASQPPAVMRRSLPAPWSASKSSSCRSRPRLSNSSWLGFGFGFGFGFGEKINVFGC